MPKLKRKAGKNIREMALRRRVKAISSFVLAGLSVLVPFFLLRTLEDFLKQLSSIGPSQIQSPSFNLQFGLYALFSIASLSSLANGIYLWKRANHADQGAKGEEDTAQEMLPLEQQGWQFEYGMRLGNRLGDADIVCISPKGKAYVIDVKSHRGEVKTDGTRLYRLMGRKTYPFEKNFLTQATKQALQVKKQKALGFVTPVVSFSDAKVSVPSNKLQQVYVVEKSKLVQLLKTLG